jgi:RHS repeat-associated protein
LPSVNENGGEFVVRTLVPIDETTPDVDRKYHLYRRDNLGRIIWHKTPWDQTTKTEFDGIHVRVEPLGIPETVTKIDALGRPIEVVDAKMGVTSYTYGPFGYLLTVTDPGGAITTTNRDAFGRVRTSSDPDRGSTTIHYSGFGEARSTLDALGREARFTYDRLGRLVRRIDPDGETRWNYDIAPNGIGALANVVSPTGVIRRFGYDTQGRMASSDTSINGEVFTVRFGYDVQSRLSRITYPAINGTSFVVENHYDDAGHLVRVNELGQPTDLWALTDVNPNGFISGEQFGYQASQGARTKRTYDEDHGLVKTIATLGQGPLQSLSYTYDKLLNLETRTDHLQGVAGRVETFTYDKLQRLHCASFDNESECTREWRYSANGNLTVSPTAGTYTYDPARPHTVNNTNLGSYQHDAVGNQIGRPDATVQYTALDLPKRIDWTNGDVATFEYDGNRQRVRKTSGLLESIFVGEWYERVTNAGVMEHRHYIHSSERVVAVVTKSSVGTKTQFLHPDNLGSVDVVSTSNGTLEERRSYDPFGTRRNPQWGQPPGQFTTTTTLGFTGHFGDEELGLVFMRGRVYDPGLGRFLTPDPFVSNAYSGQSWHRYAYVENNPLKYTDPSGFQAKPDLDRTIFCCVEQEVKSDYGKDKSPEPEIEEEDEAVELGALRTMIDFGSFGDSAGFQPDVAASGSERDRSDKHNVMLEVLGGAASAYGQDVLHFSAGAVAFFVFPPAYFAWQGYNFWSSVASGGIEGYRQDGVFGAVAGAINAVNLFAHVGISLAKTIDAAERGDYAGAGENGYRTAVGIAGIAAAAIGGGIARGGGGRGLADAAQAARPRPGTVAVLETPQGTFNGASGTRQPVHPRVQEALDSVPEGSRSPFHGKCAEPQCISRALEAGVEPSGGRMTSFRVRSPGHPDHGTIIPPCASCAAIQRAFGIE